MKTFTGCFLIGIALFMTLGFFTSTSDPDPMVEAIAVFVGVILPLASGAYLLWSQRKDGQRLVSSRQALSNQTLYAEIFALASRESGRLTVFDVVKHLGLDIARAEQALDEMALKQLAEHQLTDDGLLVYVFRDSLLSKDRPRAIEDF